MNLKFHVGRAPRSTRAFTMIEIALSLAIIGFALVAIIGILPLGLTVQRDNREETLINFDANFLMDTIRSGAKGQDNLTNFVITITNAITRYDSNNIVVAKGVNWFTTSNFSMGGVITSTNFLVSGSNIVGILTSPKYIVDGFGGYFSNYVTADFRAITGSAMDQGTNQSSKDFAFRYRVAFEVIPSADFPYLAPDPTWENISIPNLIFNLKPQNRPQDNPSHSKDWPVAKNLQGNMNQIRLKFRWPVFAQGNVGNNREVFRSSASGVVTNFPTGIGGLTLFYIRPDIYVGKP
ncbi:MAG: hypothetical protein JWR26_4026 [Pedosphaera sp.]|nr:hypothetical protein [Pedosphaera sp.]